MSFGKNLLAFKSGVKKIRPQDRELSDVQDNLGNSLQQVMDHLVNQQNGKNQGGFSPVLYQPNPNVKTLAIKIPALQIFGRLDGSFQVNQPSVIFGEPSYVTATGSVAQRDSCLFSYGQIVAFGSQVLSDGFVIIPQVLGAAFRIAYQNAVNVFAVDTSGNTYVGGALSTAGGIKSWLPGMFYWNTSYPGGTLPLVIAVVNGSQTGTTPWGQLMTRAGSIVGLTAYHTAATNMVCAVYIYKNGSQFYAYNITNNTSAGFVAIPKGSLPFVAGDFLAAKITYSSANINVCTQVAIEVEEVA